MRREGRAISGTAYPAVGDVAVGDPIGELVVTPTEITLFRFSALTWNPHRIHFDAPYAATEGYPGPLVHAHLHGSYLARLVVEWAGPRARLTRFRWQNRQYAIPGDELRITGTVTAVDGRLVDCELVETNQRGETCAPGWATVELPECDA
ncbi:MaoC/PaaZ C-terminal domain-containing protein [Pseudonocardia sulfidoxydans]|uniref:MaoC/PaaZ C-terminal domain-containing protein n=1 Tax=Pseudonocardia sulfidoxydans TaxID=54011 RepID=UPI0011BF9F39|nr:MaoC/PaaZ C-terminal domain-containing protein [Pseudonocardia sulfidoxydans]